MSGLTILQDVRSMLTTQESNNEWQQFAQSNLGGFGQDEMNALLNDQFNGNGQVDFYDVDPVLLADNAEFYDLVNQDGKEGISNADLLYDAFIHEEDYIANFKIRSMDINTVEAFISIAFNNGGLEAALLAVEYLSSALEEDSQKPEIDLVKETDEFRGTSAETGGWQNDTSGETTVFGEEQLNSLMNDRFMTDGSFDFFETPIQEMSSFDEYYTSVNNDGTEGVSNADLLYFAFMNDVDKSAEFELEEIDFNVSHQFLKMAYDQSPEHYKDAIKYMLTSFGVDLQAAEVFAEDNITTPPNVLLNDLGSRQSEFEFIETDYTDSDGNPLYSKSTLVYDPLSKSDVMLLFAPISNIDMGFQQIIDDYAGVDINGNNFIVTDQLRSLLVNMGLSEQVSELLASVISTETTTFSDTSLGRPEPGVSYAQVLQENILGIYADNFNPIWTALSNIVW